MKNVKLCLLLWITTVFLSPALFAQCTKCKEVDMFMSMRDNVSNLQDPPNVSFTVDNNQLPPFTKVFTNPPWSSETHWDSQLKIKVMPFKIYIFACNNY